MATAADIRKPAVLAVEGADEVFLVLALLEHMKRTECVDLGDVLHLHDLKGQTGLPAKLVALALAMAESPTTASLGVLLDAEPPPDSSEEPARSVRTPAESALDRVLTALRAALGPAAHLAGHGTFTAFDAETLDGRPLRAAAFIAPDGESAGMLEDLCLSAGAVRSAPETRCVDEYLECLRSVGVHRPDWAKRRLGAYLAACEEPGRQLGRAAEAGCWHFEDPVWDPLKQFLHDLAQV